MDDSILLFAGLAAFALIAFGMTAAISETTVTETETMIGDQAVTDQSNVTPDPNATDANPFLEIIMEKVNDTFGLWSPPAKYAQAIANAESANSIPSGMLARLLYQESHYRESIISGSVTSPVGALGIAQFMPATARDMGINPLDPFQAIPAAARYLASLYRQTGTWTKALAAYNWGIGNVTRKGIASAPTETRNYYSQILADVNSASGTTYA